VHCMGGVSRSPTIILAYLMERYNLSLKKALQYMVDRKDKVCPNTGFYNQLEEYEKKLKWERK